MKITDNKIAQAEVPRITADSAASAAKDSTADKTAYSAGPAASIKIANPAMIANAQVLAASGNLSDDKLLDKIRDRIANGTFDIDYGSLAQTMLADAIATSGTKGGKTDA